MVNKPTSSLDWTEGNPDQATISVEPNATKKENGWEAGEQPPRQTTNWQLQNIDEWQKYLAQEAAYNNNGQFSILDNQSVAANITGLIADKSKYQNWSLEAYIDRQHKDVAGVEDVSFHTNMGTGFNSALTGVAVDKDDNVVVVGAYSGFNSNGLNYITKLDKDGNEDTAFTSNCGSGPDSLMNDVDVDSQGNIYICGVFNNWDGSPSYNKFLKLSPDGVVDSVFYNNMSGGLISTTYSCKVQYDGKIVVGGSFSPIGFGTRNYIVRLNSDGTEDAPFYTNLGTAFNGFVNQVELQSNKKILVRGAFTQLDGNTRNYLVRLNEDGNEDTAFYAALGTGFAAEPYIIKSIRDGRILIGGDFTTFNSNTRNRLVCLNEDGTEDVAFYNNLPAAITSGTSVQSIKQLRNGRILVGGDFTSHNLLLLEADGTLVTSFSTNIGTGFGSNVTRLAEQSDGQIIVGGVFTTLNGNPRNYMVNLSGDLFAREKQIFTIEKDDLENLSLSEVYQSGDDSEIDLAIDASTGQITYTSSNVGGTLVTSEIYYALRNGKVKENKSLLDTKGRFVVEAKSVPISENVNVSNVNVLTFTGTVSINGLSGGIEGQRIKIIGLSNNGKLTINHNNASGNQKFLNTSENNSVSNGFCNFDIVYYGGFWFNTQQNNIWDYEDYFLKLSNNGYLVYGNLHIQKINNWVTLNYFASVNNSPDPAPNTYSGIIPTRFRPSDYNAKSNLYSVGTLGLFHSEVQPDGDLLIHYTNWSGSNGNFPIRDFTLTTKYTVEAMIFT